MAIRQEGTGNAPLAQQERRINLRPAGAPAEDIFAPNKRVWVVDEDNRLKQLVDQHGTGNWSLIGDLFFPDRTGKQCRERWNNHLCPGLKKGSWSEEEDQVIMTMQKTIGNQWAKITKMLPGRTDNAVKNRYHILAVRPQRAAARPNTAKEDILRITNMVMLNGGTFSAKKRKKEGGEGQPVKKMIKKFDYPSSLAPYVKKETNIGGEGAAAFSAGPASNSAGPAAPAYALAIPGAPAVAPTAMIRAAAPTAATSHLTAARTAAPAAHHITSPGKIRTAPATATTTAVMRAAVTATAPTFTGGAGGLPRSLLATVMSGGIGSYKLPTATAGIGGTTASYSSSSSSSSSIKFGGEKLLLLPQPLPSQKALDYSIKVPGGVRMVPPSAATAAIAGAIPQSAQYVQQQQQRAPNLLGTIIARFSGGSASSGSISSTRPQVKKKEDKGRGGGGKTGTGSGTMIDKDNGSLQLAADALLSLSSFSSSSSSFTSSESSSSLYSDSSSSSFSSTSSSSFPSTLPASLSSWHSDLPLSRFDPSRIEAL